MSLGSSFCNGFQGVTVKLEWSCALESLEPRIPGSGQGDRHRKNGAKTVDQVESENQRDMQAGFFDGQMLATIDLSGIGDKEERA